MPAYQKYHFQQNQSLMAFVSEAQRQLNPVSKLTNPVAPGQYFNDDIPFSQVRKAAAPFHSTFAKKSIFQPTGKTMPGPGDYDAAKPFIEPNIKTVSNSQSIIVKINSTGTSPFKSMSNRFEERVSQEPGPGQYYYGDIPKKRKSLSNSVIKQTKISEKIKKIINSSANGEKPKYSSIPQKVRGLTDAKKQQISSKQKVGPGAYNWNIKNHGNQTSTVWGKDRTKRFSLDGKTQVGPGKYNAQFNPVRPQDKVRQPSHGFKSGTVRTYFDSLIYRTNLDQTVQQRNKSHYVSREPAPGQYNVNISAINVKEKPFSFQFFGSTVQRFPEEEQTNPKHKSFYNIKSDIGKNNSFNKLSHSFMCAQPRDPTFLDTKTTAIPGPGQYADKVTVQKKLRGINIQQFGSTTKRPFNKRQNYSEIGPGKYEHDSTDQESVHNHKFGQIKQESAYFRSTTNRNCFGNSKNQNPFAQYDTSHYDLSKKIEKQKNFIENLKKIDVEKAPFESTISRFPHYQGKKPEPQNKIQEAKNAQLKIKQQAQRVRNMMIEANRSQVTQKSQNSYFNKQERFRNGKRGGPPVGQYNMVNNWQKKSHNIKYQQK